MKYTRTDHITWKLLTTKRRKKLPDEACEMYLTGLKNLQLPTNYIPSHDEINHLIKKFTNWEIIPTDKLIPTTEYFKMLSKYQFPANATIRPRSEINYYTNVNPDVVHEYLGHCPFLTDKKFATFMQQLALKASAYSTQEQELLGRLFWYTTEFGLINTEKGLRVYGAGIIPSESESKHALYGKNVQRRSFNLLEVLRTPFSALKKQTIYYVIDSFDALYSLLEKDLTEPLSKALRLGDISYTGI